MRGVKVGLDIEKEEFQTTTIFIELSPPVIISLTLRNTWKLWVHCIRITVVCKNGKNWNSQYNFLQSIIFCHDVGPTCQDDFLSLHNLIEVIRTGMTRGARFSIMKRFQLKAFNKRWHLRKVFRSRVAFLMISWRGWSRFNWRRRKTTKLKGWVRFLCSFRFCENLKLNWYKLIYIFEWCSVIQQAFIWDAYLEKLPSVRHLDYPSLNPTRQYGTPWERTK